ncbi:MAG: molybdenum cofactor carrier [Deltaproteobacteria bacterium]|nr:MAG: molybdenum cofactor carrier [Deltaproteobacteria bacterium]
MRNSLLSVPLVRIVSGGQTGADRGGLEAAIALGIEHGGWCPRGRRAEDGRIPDRYRLRETESADYAQRTERNVLDSDGTVLFTRGAPTGGSALTAALARRHAKPLLHVDLASTDERTAACALRAWLADRGIATLNVAGSRESGCPGISDAVRRIVTAAVAAP